MVLNDFFDQIPAEYEFSNGYLNLYSDYSEKFQKIFAYLHSSFDALFEFMNYKSSTNKHFNADPSRELKSLISYFKNLQLGLKNSENEIAINSHYAEMLDYCLTFLLNSGGSPIPDDYKDFQISKYDPIFQVSNKRITIPILNQNNELRLIGEGAFSIVKRYKDQYYNKYFALKQAKKDITERELERFRKEFQILQELQFPYILEVYNYDSSKECYTMEYCDTTLREYISKRNQTLTFSIRKKIALQFLYAVNYLHKKGIFHRDISPNNILVKQYDFDSVLVKLSDFGLIKENGSEFTKTDTDMKGTIIDPALDAFKNYGIKNEIYPIGFILQFIFTGKQNLDFSDAKISNIVAKCTDRDQKSRYGDVLEIIDDVDNLQT